MNCGSSIAVARWFAPAEWPIANTVVVSAMSERFSKAHCSESVTSSAPEGKRASFKGEKMWFGDMFTRR